MAFASTRIGAQEAIIKPCDLCEDDEDVNWFCKDCDQNLCERCKRLHLRSNVSKSHIVLSISEGLVMSRKNISNMCKDHNEPFLFLCRTCDENICPTCLPSEHQKHDVVEIRKLQSEMQKQLDRVIKTKEEEIKVMMKNYDELDQYGSESDNYLVERYGYIENRVEAIKFAANDEEKKLKERLRAKVEQEDTEVKEGQDKIHTQTKLYETQIQTVQREFRLQNASSLKGFVKKSVSNLESLRPITIAVPNRSKLFFEEHFDQNKIRKMIGNIGQNEIEAGEYNSLSELEVINSFQLRYISDCTCMCLGPDECILIGSNDALYKWRPDHFSVLCRFSKERSSLDKMIGKLEKMIGKLGLELQRPICSIACLPSSGVLLCRKAGHVYKVNWDETREEFINLHPKIAYGIAIIKNDRVVINADFEYIAIFSNAGKPIREIKIDDGISTFCIDNDGNIIIAHPDSSRLTLLDGKSGDVKMRWSVITTNIKLLACDRLGNLLASNRKESMYVISKTRKVQKTFTIHCDAVMGICVNQDDHLMILVTENGENKIIEVKYLD